MEHNKNIRNRTPQGTHMTKCRYLHYAMHCELLKSLYCRPYTYIGVLKFHIAILTRANIRLSLYIVHADRVRLRIGLAVVLKQTTNESSCMSKSDCIPNDKVACSQTISHLPIYWAVFFESKTSAELIKAQQQQLPRDLVRVADPHVTLLYAGAAQCEADAARRSGITRERFQELWKSVIEWEGFEVEVSFDRIVRDADGACLLATHFTEELPCANSYAHVTLGHSSRTTPFRSNELLSQAAVCNWKHVSNGPEVHTLDPAVSLQGVVRARYPHGNTADSRL